MRTARVGRTSARALGAVVALSAVFLPASAGASRGGSYSALIVNGTKTTLAKWPYIVGVLDRSEPSTFLAQFCGGSLVTPTLVLSAAHCTFDSAGEPIDPGDVDVLVNADDLSLANVTPEGQRIAVNDIIRHPSYDDATIQNDFALFELASPASAPPVAVVPPSSDYRWRGGKTSRVAGFGCEEYDASPGECTAYPFRLRETPLPMLSDAACENLGGVYGSHFDRDNMVCAGTLGDIVETEPGLQEGTAKSPCFGDSGGPLVVEGPAGVDYQVGVVSWGPSACGIGPGVFSRLGTSAVRQWLRDNGVPVARSPFAAGPAVRIDGDFTTVPGDFDGDGKDDLFLYSPGSGRDFLRRGNGGGFLNGPHVSMGGDYRPVAGDFDGDGKDDIFWFGPGPAPDVLWRGTALGFAAGPAVSVNRYAIAVAGDFDGDTLDDILFYGPGTTSDALLLGTAGGFAPGPAVSNNQYYAPVAGDFDGDGTDDIVWYGAGSRFDMWWRGTASGFVSAGALTIGGAFQPVPGDFDGDGKTDIMWFAAKGADMLRRGSVSGFQSAPEVVLDGTFTGAPGDFDADGRADIVWYAKGSAGERHWRGVAR